VRGTAPVHAARAASLWCAIAGALPENGHGWCVPAKTGAAHVRIGWHASC